MMDQDEIEKLLLRVSDNEGQVPEEVRGVFSKMVTTTLHYRDDLKKRKGIILTVADVRATIDWLIESLHSGKLPETQNSMRLDLLTLWLEALRPDLAPHK